MIYENLIAMMWDFILYTVFAYIMPAFCLRPYTKNWCFTKKFFAYQTIANLYIVFIMHILGFIGIVSRVSVILLIIVLPLALSVFLARSKFRNFLRFLSNFIRQFEMGVYGWGLLRTKVKTKIKNKFQKIRSIGSRMLCLEILVILAGMIWIIYFYGYYKATFYGYSCPDEEVHLYWITELIHNNIFPSGMYPHGIHSLNAVLALFSPYSIARTYICFSVTIAILVYLSAYLLFRKHCRSKCSCLIAIAVVTVANIFQYDVYSRFQMSLPMEFGLIALFGMVYFMMEYVSKRKKEDLIFFSLCISWTFMAHFYVTIFCAVICVIFGLVYFMPIIKRKLLIPFMVAGICGIILSVLPFAVGFICGYEFEQSIAWALNTSKKTYDTREEYEIVEELTAEEIQSEKLNQEIKEANIIEKIPLHIELAANYLCRHFLKKPVYAYFFILMSFISILIGAVAVFLHKKTDIYLKYIFWGLLWLVGAYMATSFYYNVLVLIEIKRMAMFLSFFCIPLIALFLDLIYAMFEKMKMNTVYLQFLSLILFVGIMLLGEDTIRSVKYTYYVCSELDMKNCLNLVENEKKDSWTVVSTTNDLSIVRYNGFHYELVELVYALDRKKNDIYIPTPDIYVCLEKKFSVNRYFHKNHKMSSEYLQNLDKKHAYEVLDYNPSKISNTIYMTERDVIMTKAFYWMEGLKKVYPNHVQLLEEDDQAIVYKIHQDEYFPLNLSIDYKKYIR